MQRRRGDVQSVGARHVDASTACMVACRDAVGRIEADRTRRPGRRAGHAFPIPHVGLEFACWTLGACPVGLPAGDAAVACVARAACGTGRRPLAGAEAAKARVRIGHLRRRHCLVLPRRALHTRPILVPGKVADRTRPCGAPCRDAQQQCALCCDQGMRHPLTRRAPRSATLHRVGLRECAIP